MPKTGSDQLFAQLGVYFSSEASYARYFDPLVQAAEQAFAQTDFSWRDLRLLEGSASVARKPFEPDRATVPWAGAHAIILVGGIPAPFPRQSQVEIARSLRVPGIHLLDREVKGEQLTLPVGFPQARFTTQEEFRSQVADFVYSSRAAISQTARRHRKSQPQVSRLRQAVEAEWEATSGQERVQIASNAGVSEGAITEWVSDDGRLESARLRDVFAVVAALGLGWPAKAPTLSRLTGEQVQSLASAAQEHVWPLATVVELALTGASRIATGPVSQRLRFTQERDWKALYDETHGA